MEGFAALTGGEPPAIRACVPALAQLLGVKASLLGDLVAVAGRDADNLTALCNALDMVEVKPILECLVNLYSREQPRVRAFIMYNHSPYRMLIVRPYIHAL